MIDRNFIRQSKTQRLVTITGLVNDIDRLKDFMQGFDYDNDFEPILKDWREFLLEVFEDTAEDLHELLKEE